MQFGVGMMGGFEPARFQRIVGQAERLGYSHLWVADEGLYRNVYTTLAVASLSSSTIMLGTCVTNPYTRHPALTAAAIATIDELSGGRAVLGLGAGGSATTVLGLQRAHPVDAVRDAIAIINGLTGQGRVAYQGARLSFQGSLHFTPIRRVPIFVSARGLRMLRLAGEVADGVIVGALTTPPTLQTALDQVGAGARAAGRSLADLEIVSWLYTVIAEDRAAAVEAVSRIVAVSVINSRHSLDALGITLPAPLREALERHGWTRTEAAVQAVRERLTDDLINTFALIGPAEACAAKLRPLSGLGVTQVAALFFPPHGSSMEQQMAAFATGVMTRV